MKIYTLTFKQNIPATLETAWNYFSSPTNLAHITPPNMAFKVTSDLSEDHKMYPGMIITYKISPLPGYTTNWVTEITHVKPQNYFVDEQRAGPYAFWHHQHHFVEIPGGVAMMDLLHYAIPFGFLGRIANSMLVEKRLMEIFDFRKKKITEIFGQF